MKLQDLTDKAIKQFAGSVIFDRGYDYYINKLVYELQYDSDADSIRAQVSGNYGDYNVTITMAGEHVSAVCDCPYDGYPCKHAVAVLLTFIHNKNTYIQQETKRKKKDASLTKKIKALSKDKLVEILLSCSEKYPDVKRELMVRLEPDNTITLNTIHKQIAKAFPPIESHNYSTDDIAGKLNTIMASVENAPNTMQVKVYWAVIDGVLEELNSYGMDDEDLESVAIETMESLVEIFRDDETLQEEKATIIEELMDYYNQGNCGLVDWIYESVMELCSEKSDYQIVIDKLEEFLPKKSFKSHYQDLLSDLYENIGDTESQRKILEKNLQYGMDYWRLAEYWFGQGNEEKALEIVNQGLEKGEGRKVELYEALQKHYQKQNDYDQIFALLERKIAKNELDDYHNFQHDSTYQCLWSYYLQQNNYEGKTKLLEMRLINNDIDLDFYKKAQKTLNATDWQAFELRIINNLKGCVPKQKQLRPAWFPYGSPTEITVLAEIYHYKQDVEMLFDTVHNDVRLLVKYQSLLMPHYAEVYLKRYRKTIDDLIAARGRENYKSAVPYAKAIKKIYADVLQKPGEWTQYISTLRHKHKRLRAFQEEFARL